MRRISNPVKVAVHSFSEACGPITKPGKMTRIGNPVTMSVHSFSLAAEELERSLKAKLTPSLLITIRKLDGATEADLPEAMAKVIKMASQMDVNLEGHGLELDVANSTEAGGAITFRLQPRLSENAAKRLDDIRNRLTALSRNSLEANEQAFETKIHNESRGIHPKPISWSIDSIDMVNSG
ncbi:MAG: hypothetical protein U0798_13040 [Gemmataceae bacterium]